VDTVRRRALRAAISQLDGGAVVTAVEGIELDRYLQLAGDGLLIAVAQQAPGAAALAERCATMLRDRFWDGDEELALELEAAVGTRPPSGLTDVVVDLDELAEVLESNDVDGGALDLVTGEVWTASTIDYADEVGEERPDLDDHARWLSVSADGPAEGYRDMQDFIASVDDADIADRLRIAIDGQGAFRRFRDVLQRWEAVEDNWYRFSDERRRARARAWLASTGYRPTHRQESAPTT
jgi:Uncharacterised protein family (UPF0158)